MDEPPRDSYISVAGQSGAIYSAGALQLDTKIAVWSDFHPHSDHLKINVKLIKFFI